jgi:hypothetical protein
MGVHSRCGISSRRDATPIGHTIFKADRVKITEQDVIAVEGLRKPLASQSQKKFNTGMVVVEHGKTPSKELIDRANGIREKWIDYWSVTTGRRSSMTAPKEPRRAQNPSYSFRRNRPFRLHISISSSQLNDGTRRSPHVMF